MRRLDVASLIVGLLLTGVAGIALWQSIVGHVDWRAIKIAAPLTLVVLGIIGLSLSRNRS